MSKRGTEDAPLGRAVAAQMSQITIDKIQPIALANAEANRPYYKHGTSIAELPKLNLGKENHAAILSASPSLWRNQLIEQYKAEDYHGALVCTDSALYSCLKSGVVPDLVVTLDPHRKRIVRWFGDPVLNQQDLDRDDYFARQDLDPAFAAELETNRQIIEMLNKHGPKVRIALSSSSPPAVTERAIEAGMQIFWWNPMFDDPSVANGVTQSLFKMNGFPCVNACGNVGAASWMFAHAVLGKQSVALMGLDFSYYSDLPYINTQYYVEAKEIFGEDRLDEFFIKVHNPHIDQWFYTDPTYFWYRQVFFEAVDDSDCFTANCTGGGIVFNERVQWMNFKQFVQLMNKQKSGRG